MDYHRMASRPRSCLGVLGQEWANLTDIYLEDTLWLENNLWRVIQETCWLRRCFVWNKSLSLWSKGHFVLTLQEVVSSVVQWWEWIFQSSYLLSNLTADVTGQPWLEKITWRLLQWRVVGLADQMIEQNQNVQQKKVGARWKDHNNLKVKKTHLPRAIHRQVVKLTLKIKLKDVWEETRCWRLPPLSLGGEAAPCMSTRKQESCICRQMDQARRPLFVEDE